jgi:hypothetical protein
LMPPCRGVATAIGDAVATRCPFYRSPGPVLYSPPRTRVDQGARNHQVANASIDPGWRGGDLEPIQTLRARLIAWRHLTPLCDPTVLPTAPSRGKQFLFQGRNLSSGILCFNGLVTRFCCNALRHRGALRGGAWLIMLEARSCANL